jgi:enoyl-CoA hydratase/carnithine racemase
VVPGADLRDSALWASTEIANSPAVAVQGTVRALWMARELSRLQALDMGKILIRLGSDPKALYEGQQSFAAGRRIQPRKR